MVRFRNPPFCISLTVISVSDISLIIFICFPPKYLDGRSTPSWFMKMKVRFLCLPSEWVAMKAFNDKFLYNSCTFKSLSGRQVGDDLLFPLFILQEMVLLDGSKLVTCFGRTKSVLLWNHPRIIQSKNAPLITLIWNQTYLRDHWFLVTIPSFSFLASVDKKAVCREGCV